VNASSSTEFTASDGRRFAFPVGTAFLVLAAILWWREHETAMWVMVALGGSLYLAGLIAPRHLAGIHRAWMAMALAISKVTTPIFMGIVYFLVLTPVGLLMRSLGKNPIRHAEQPDGGFWRRIPEGRRGDMRRQF
jgi:uncharacterized membrane protein